MISPRCHYSPDSIIPLSGPQRETRNRLLHQLLSGTVTLQPASCLCGESGGTLLAERDRWGLPVSTVLCTRCALVRTSPRLPDSYLPAFYEHDYRLLMDGISSPTPAAFELQQRRGREAMECLVATGPVGPGTRVYEIGCSAGGVLQPFLQAGCTVAGSDYDVRFLANARSLGIETRHGGWETLKDLPAPDVILLSHVVEHLNDPIDFVRSVASLLKPGGRLFIAVPGLDAIADDYCGDLVRYLQICHTFHFTRRTLLQTLRSAGLIPIHADDSVRSVSVTPPAAAAGLPQEPEDPQALQTRLTSLEEAFLNRESQPLRRARRIAGGIKRIVTSSR